jgi:hypothetical protein
MRTQRLSLVGLAVALVLTAACGGGTQDVAAVEDWSVPPAGTSAQLSARVTFDAMQIATENRGPDRWRDVVIEVRRAATGRSFHYKTDVLVEGRTLPVGALNFEAADGRRLSPFEGAPTEWRIRATLPAGRRGVASGQIEAVSPK